MARINLLPWRAERREQRQREFYAMLGAAAIIGFLLSGLIWFHYDQQISGQNVRNQFLKDEIAKVEVQIKEIEALDKQKDRLLARKKVIEQLQANRSQMVHLFDSLVRTIPDGVALSNIKQEGEILTLEGRAQSNARVSAYMRNLEGSGWMTRPDLSIIEAKADEKDAKSNALVSDSRALPYMFNLKVLLANPNATPEGEQPLLEAEGAAPADPATATPAVESAPAAEAQPAAAPPATTAPAPAAEGTAPASAGTAPAASEGE
ncbi:PilN domain-containing protein [Pseudoxanthomonas wuyuanensis]|uniref:Type IV pilus assembly protein PilN n=1 Tax=Pseudoxanthomonas wuyuanensis TaxID=1073196 RepID=A0A286D3Q4_9GAMM|nr:PilN domain-containing protein [Pseudoxanthomonas wuyuanensis]KAF1722946.1 fimbrial protein [Pseudoxanthomonas wuyuanensis]SOD53216.1 type IV pilus assembly protein PilN [Pseudoxanthomonas wuyuanensis]